MQAIKSLAISITALIVAAVVLPKAAQACTLVLWNDNGRAVLNSRSMDSIGSSKPRLTVLPRGMECDGSTFLGKKVVGENPAKWTSKHGSVVVTVMNARTADGMNEKGLGVNALWLNAADYGPKDTSRAGVQASMWSQYVLDNAATVNEAIALQSRIQPVDVTLLSDSGEAERVPLALTVEDVSGDSAIMQYIDGKLVIHHGYEYLVMSNDPPYDQALAELAKYDFTNATRDLPLPGNTNSLGRFIRANC